jgi:hypothetical protein
MIIYTQHPLSAAFPAMPDDAYVELRDSIKVVGVLNPITLYQGMVLDGWHRYSAAQELGMNCPTVELADWIDPKDFVMAQNKLRRHITAAQLAIVTVAVYRWYDHGANRHTMPQKTEVAAAAVAANEEMKVGTQCPSRKTTAELSEISGVGERTIKQAKAVQAKAVPEVIDAVRRGDMGLVKASGIAKLPQAEQVAAMCAPAKAMPSDAAASLLEMHYDDGPSDEEMADLVAAQKADAALIAAMLDADDAMKLVVDELAAARAQLLAMTQSRNGYMNQCAELIALVKTRDRQIAKLQKQGIQ